MGTTDQVPWDHKGLAELSPGPCRPGQERVMIWEPQRYWVGNPVRTPSIERETTDGTTSIAAFR